MTAELIDALVAALARSPQAAGIIAAAPITDTVKRVGGGRTIERTEDRERLWAAQTPQVFRSSALREAHASDAGSRGGMTDDALLVERAGGKCSSSPLRG